MPCQWNPLRRLPAPDNVTAASATGFGSMIDSVAGTAYREVLGRQARSLLSICRLDW